MAIPEPEPRLEGMPAPGADPAAAADLARPGSRRALAASLRRHPEAMAGLVVLALVVIAGILGPLLLSGAAVHQSLLERLQPPVWAGGSIGHPLGTDQLGRDVLARAIVASRVSLTVGVLAVVLSAVLGGAVGLVAGYYGGVVDRVLMRLADIQLSVPYILLAIATIAVLGPSLRNVIIVLGIGGWTSYARILRSLALSVRQKEFVEAAIATGTRTRRVIVRHVLPQTMSAFWVIASLGVGQVIITESALSFLGLGVQPPDVTWGTMVGDGRDYLSNAWWVSTVPGVVLMVVILAINLVADWLNEALDPITARR